MLFGIQFQDIHTFIDLKERWMECDVLLRIISIAILGIISIFILFIPYNWRKSSADGQLLRRFVILSEITSVIFYCDCFAGNQIWATINFLWGVFFFSYMTYYELKLRIIPPIEAQDLPDEPEPIQPDNTQDDLWQRISCQMEKNEIWRNPDVSVEIMSRDVGTNRIYVADCIREHTGLTFNDFLNNSTEDLAFM